MATADARNIVRGIGGTLIAAPTDLTLASPYGGTELGVVKQVRFRYGYKTWKTTGEEWGGATTAVGYAGEEPYLMAVLREFDDDLLQKIFPNTSAGVKSQKRVVRGQVVGTIRAGEVRTGFKLLYAAESPTHPSILLYNAIASLEDTSELTLSFGEELGTVVVFDALPDSDGNMYDQGRITDLAQL